MAFCLPAALIYPGRMNVYKNLMKILVKYLLCLFHILDLDPLVSLRQHHEEVGAALTLHKPEKCSFILEQMLRSQYSSRLHI